MALKKMLAHIAPFGLKGQLSGCLLLNMPMLIWPGR